MTAVGQRIAFVVNSETGPELRAGSRDTSRVYSALTDPELGGCDPKRSSIVPNCPSKADFDARFSGTLEDWTPANELFFYFSGHGQIRDKAFCLQFGPKQYVSFGTILDELNLHYVGRAVLIIDACHSGGALGEKSAREARRKREKSKLARLSARQSAISTMREAIRKIGDKKPEDDETKVRFMENLRRELRGPNQAWVDTAVALVGEDFRLFWRICGSHWH